MFLQEEHPDKEVNCLKLEKNHPTKLVSMHCQSHGVVIQCDASKHPNIDQRADIESLQ